MEVQAKLFFGLIDKDGNGMLSRIEMKQFLAIHHLKNGSANILSDFFFKFSSLISYANPGNRRTGNLPEAADQAELDSVLEQVY